MTTSIIDSRQVMDGTINIFRSRDWFRRCFPSFGYADYPILSSKLISLFIHSLFNSDESWTVFLEEESNQECVGRQRPRKMSYFLDSDFLSYIKQYQWPRVFVLKVGLHTMINIFFLKISAWFWFTHSPHSSNEVGNKRSWPFNTGRHAKLCEILQSRDHVFANFALAYGDHLLT